MKKRSYILFLCVIAIGLGACKSAFEEVRTSNDPPRILAAANKFFEDEEYFRAQQLYELIIPYYRGKKEAEDLFYNYTYTFYNQSQYILAAHYFNNYTKTFYNSPRKEEMAFMSAFSNYRMSPNAKLDQTPSEQAIEELQLFINTYPSSDRVDECNKLMDEIRSKLELKSFNEGQLYYDLKSYQAAISSLENTLKDFPETTRAEELRYLIVKSNEQLARKSVYEKMEERLENTITIADKFLKKYPKSTHKRELRDIISFCNNELKRFTND